MKKRNLLVGLLAATMLFTSCSGKPDGAVAKVGNDYITKEDFEKEFLIYKNMFYPGLTAEEMEKAGQNGTTPNRDLGQKVTEALVLDKLMEAELAKNKIEIKDEDIKAEIDKFKEQAGGEEQFKAQLEMSNVKEEDLNYIVKRGLKDKALFKWFKEANKPSKEEMEKYFEEKKDTLVTYDLAHILVDTEEEAKAIKADLDAGKDFAEIAKEKSKDTGSAVKGGDLGENVLSMYVPEFSEGVKNTEVGKISDPVKSQFGYHIIKVKGMKGDVEALEDQILTGMLGEKYQIFIQSLFAKGNITKYEPSEYPKVPDAPKAPEAPEAPKTEEKSETKSEEKSETKSEDKSEEKSEAKSE